MINAISDGISIENVWELFNKWHIISSDQYQACSTKRTSLSDCWFYHEDNDLEVLHTIDWPPQNFELNPFGLFCKLIGFQ